MKKINLLFSLVALILFSCNKENPPTGLYMGDFFGTYTSNGNTYDESLVGIQLEITETDKNHILISGASLEKDGKKIKGVLNLQFHKADLITIDGKWKKVNGNYVIEGDFTSNYLFTNAQPPTTLPVKGTFKIESTF